MRPLSQNLYPLCRSRSGRRRTFTIVELLVVVAIISVLAGMLLPALEQAYTSARQVQCANQLKQVGTATEMYAGDNGDYFPLAHWFEPLVSRSHSLGPYLDLANKWEWQRDTVLTCPALKTICPPPASASGQWRRTYTLSAGLPADSYHATAAKKLTAVKQPGQTVFFFDGAYDGNWYMAIGNKGNTAGGVRYPHANRENISYVDQHVKPETVLLWTAAEYNSAWYPWMQ